MKHDRYGGIVGCSFVVYNGKVQVSGQRSKEKVVHMAPVLVSLAINKRGTSAQVYPVFSSSIFNTTCVHCRHRVFCRAPVHCRSV